MRMKHSAALKNGQITDQLANRNRKRGTQRREGPWDVFQISGITAGTDPYPAVFLCHWRQWLRDDSEPAGVLEWW